MKNKKGFTLVELLAVIVLLGLLAILITPKITETLKKQKKAIFTNSVEGIVNAINNDIADDSSISTEMSQYRAYKFDVNKLYLIVEDNMSKDESIEISGKIKNGTGRVVVTDVNKIALAITDGKYCAKKGANERDINVTEMGAEDKCELEEGVFTEGSSCFIFEENPDETLTITGYDYNNSSCSKELVIPNRINGKTVTKIKEGAFFDYD
ncbi:MAG: type II secretion system protein, partial [Bacilli bacterium]|nr:type II secretion system protein [Bacilli bacterium]